MKYLLDTCVISELVKRKPNDKVIQWIENQQEEALYLSVISIGEIQKGISKLPESDRKQKLQVWLKEELSLRFEKRIMNIDIQVAKTWGEIQSKAEQKGKSLPAIDSLIAATGLAYQLTVITRNIEDMVESGVNLYNPWEVEPIN
ncbi:MAG: type II toxin-antitoxin system VapC family toxin [SAR324 cluster bacterium]|nr:type II toxin-antitoxin system VapC family toxin [SAR324 cluster bacterium]